MSKLEELIQRYCSDGVEYKPLCSFSEQFSGMTGVSNKWAESGNCMFIDYMNVYKHLSVDTSALKYATVKSQNQNTLKVGDILFTSASETPDECALASVIEDTIQEGVFLDDHLFGLRLLDDYCNTISPSYLKYAFHSALFRTQVKTVVRGVTRHYVSKTDFMKLEIPIPPLPIQKEIVRILDTFSELQTGLIPTLETELEKRKQQYNYYRDCLLSFKERTDVEWTKLGDLCKNLDRKRKPITAGKREPGIIPYYGASGIVDYVKDFIFDGDYLLVSEDGANLLTRTYPIAFSIHGKTWVNNHAHIIEFKERTTRKFVEYYLNSIDLSPWISAGAQPKLTQDNLNRLIIPVPPLSEQEKIVNILDRFQDITSDLSRGLPAEIEKRRLQYEYYRDKLLTFKRK